MSVYKSRFDKLPATDYTEAVKLARREYHAIEKRSRRLPYIRSKYFKKEKVFVNQFWEHLDQKNRKDGLRRVRFFRAAIDVIENSLHKPQIRRNPNSPHEYLYRFAGKTPRGEYFYVQVKENRKTKRKYFMSVFPK